MEHNAAIYRWEKSKFIDLLSSSKQRKELSSVHKAAKKLTEAMDGLSWQPERAMAKHSEQRGMAAFFSDGDNPDDETTLLSVPNDDGSEGHVLIDLPILRKLVCALEHAAHDAADELPKSRTGKQKVHGMNLWVSNIADIWSEASDQPFTRDVADGEPVTNAARFCVYAFRFVDPELDHSLVLTAMKKLIAKRKKRTGQISVEK